MNKLDAHGRGYHVLFYTTLRFNETPLLASLLDAGVRGNKGVKEHTDHKPRNALPGGLVDELARTQNYKRQSINMFLYIKYSTIVYLYGHTPLFSWEQ